MTVRANAEHTKRFLSYVLDATTGCTELRVFRAAFEKNGFVTSAQQYSRTLAGWYDNASRLAVDAGCLRGVSGYVTLNPVRMDLLARSDGRLSKAKHTTTDADVVCLRWLYVDIDPVRPADISSTEGELTSATQRRDAILADHPELAASAIWGCSGNGTWVLVRLPDYPNDTEHREIISRTLAILAVRYSDATVKVDPTTKNPSRVMCLPGTIKAKGSNRPDRPWRVVTIDSPERPVEPFDLAGWVERNSPAATLGDGAVSPAVTYADDQPKPVAQRGARRDDRAQRIHRATRYVSSIAGAVSGQSGHDQAFDAACALVKGFDLTIDEARSILYAWNATCQPPWSQTELEHKLADANGKSDDKPRGYLFEAERPGFPPPWLVNGYADPSANGHATSAINGHPGSTPNGQAPQGSEDDSEFEFSDMGNAQRLLHLHGHRVRFCKPYGDWLIYDGRRWAIDDRLQIEAFAQQVPVQILAEIPPTQNDEAIKAFRRWALASQSKDKILSLISAARSRVAVLPGDLDKDPWLLNCLNGTINLQTGKFYHHRPTDMITRLAPVNYDPMADAPNWDKFVLEVMNDDPDLVDYLRRALGYAITGVIRQHVFFCCYGRGSNGKTTLFKTLHRHLGDYASEIDSDILVAQGSVQHPTGLTELEGRRLVVAEETEDNRRLAEALVKKLTGGNAIQARKMHKDFYTFMPSHHIFFATNYKPEIRGMDPGIWRRIKLVPFEVSFDPVVPGSRKPDLGLEGKLATEGSGILNWLIQGCRDWQEYGLMEPEPILSATHDYREEMDFLGWFLDERCVADADERVVLSVVYGEYVSWCDLANTHPVSIRRFSAQLADRGFDTKKANSIVYKAGLRLKTDIERQVEMNSREEAAVPF